ncbi:MAG: conserved repeat protein [Verrucomicrobiales bacterium]|nr:conserved repeat protein [Verrucomicrobiales bacterium]
MKRFLFKRFWPGSALGAWFGRRFTKAGTLAIAGLLMTGGLAMDSEQSLAYQTFALLFCLLLAAFVFSFFFRARFSVQRHLPRFGSVGSPIRYKVLIENKTSKEQRGLVLLEDLADPRKHPAAEHALVLFEWRFIRVLRNPRRLRRVAKVEEAAIPRLAPQSSGAAEVTIIPFRRGMLRFEGVTIARSDPLGLFRSFVRMDLPQSVAILPKRYLVSPLALPGSTKYQPGGIAMASSIGESEEFVSLRDYRRGDPMRHIHWKSWAKTGRPIVKEFQDEFFVRHALILDTFAGGEKAEVFEEAVSIAASFAYTINTQESLLDLMFVGAEAFCFTAGRGVAHMEQMLEVLAAVQLCPAKRFDTLQDLVLKHAALLSGCICIFLNWNESRRELVRSLQVVGVPLLVIVVIEPGGQKKLSNLSDMPMPIHVIEHDKVQERLLEL